MKTGLLTFWCLLSAAPLLAADGWGNLKCRFVYGDGPPLVVAPAAPGQPVDESLVVGANTRGVANIVVWVRTKSVSIHPEVPALSDSPVDWQWRASRLDPHVICLRVGQKLVVKNDGPTGHALQADTFRNLPRGLVIAPGKSETIVFSEPEPLPIRVTCIHPWERAWIVVRDNPYVAVTAADGAFEIAKLPAKELEFQFWHERSGWLVAKPDWIKGRVKLKIAAGETTDLGTVQLSPALFR
jgi:hypothetical protein